MSSNNNGRIDAYRYYHILFLYKKYSKYTYTLIWVWRKLGDMRGEVIMDQYLSFYVKVDGTPHSRYRSPEGVYRIDVLNEIASIEHAASIALQAAKTSIPFLEESNSTQFSMRLFSESGEEIVISRSVTSRDEQKACFCGRAISPPENITIQR